MRLNDHDWDAFLAQHPHAHVLQTSAWGRLKSGFGWQPEYYQAGGAGALVLFRRLPLGLSVAYVPKGPLGTGWRDLWPELNAACRRRRAVFLKVEPDVWEQDAPAVAAEFAGFHPVAPVQPRRTIVIDLSGGEEAVLARMKQKTRYNIRLAEKKEVRVRQTDDVEAYYRLMQVTGQRDGFGVHAAEYYRQAYRNFAPGGQVALLLAEYDGRPLAGLMAFASGWRAWYFYGASSDEERNRMPAYLLQWEAMRWAMQRGCSEYDLWGVPDEDEDALEAGFESRSDGLWGVYRFKRGFGGRLMRSAGAWEKVYQPVLYRLYQWVLARRGAAGE